MDINETEYMIEQSDIIVSVICNTYNHESYIRQCLDGFIMQETTFAFEVLIHDDASIDKTADIIREYEAKYPDIIKPIYQTENQYSKKIGIMKSFQYPRVKGKYIALCEGDDYWIDPLKLQKQVDFLDANPEYAMCFHNAIVSYEDKKHKDHLFFNIVNKEYKGTEVYKRWIIPTASVLYRTEILYTELFNSLSVCKNIVYGDTPLFVLCAHHGKIRGMSDIMSIYRKHVGGVTHSISCQQRIKIINHHTAICKLFGSDYKNISNDLIIDNCVRAFFRSLLCRTEQLDFFFIRKSLNISIYKTIKFTIFIFFNKLYYKLNEIIG